MNEYSNLVMALNLLNRLDSTEDLNIDKRYFE